jgi:hypothetical protein
VAPRTGLILTSARDLASLRQHAAGLDVLKLVPHWGLPGGWTAASLHAALRIPRRGVIARTRQGDPSVERRPDRDYSYGPYALPHKEQVVADIRPLWEARDPGREFWVEIGNEPLLEPLPGCPPIPERYAWDYRALLAEALDACTAAFPGARFIAPAHIQNHAIPIGGRADGQAWMTAICADVYRAFDALGLHAYSIEQYARGMRQLRDAGLTGPVWLTEFALNEALPDAERGRRYAETLRVFVVAGVALYHLDELGGSDPAHFNPNYRLTIPTLESFTGAWAAPPPMPTSTPTPAPAPAPTLDGLGVRDLRPRLPVIANRVPAPRRVPVASLTLHYNGPAVSGFGDPVRELRHVVDVDVPNHQARLNADSLQYHFVVPSDGQIWQARDLRLPAAHCGHAEGNRSSLAIHLPLGGVQDATDAQWAATLRLSEALIATYRLPGRAAVRLHAEWKDTACPGPHLTRRLRAWRDGAAPGGLFRIRPDVAAANVREGPGTSFPVALGGKAQMWPGDVLDADALVVGEAVGGSATWLHRRDGLGFVHRSLAVPL